VTLPSLPYWGIGYYQKLSHKKLVYIEPVEELEETQSLLIKAINLLSLVLDFSNKLLVIFLAAILKLFDYYSLILGIVAAKHNSLTFCLNTSILKPCNKLSFPCTPPQHACPLLPLYYSAINHKP